MYNTFRVDFYYKEMPNIYSYITKILLHEILTEKYESKCVLISKNETDQEMSMVGGGGGGT